jgi:hypothetical protein
MAAQSRRCEAQPDKVMSFSISECILGAERFDLVKKLKTTSLSELKKDQPFKRLAARCARHCCALLTSR